MNNFKKTLLVVGMTLIATNANARGVLSAFAKPFVKATVASFMHNTEASVIHNTVSTDENKIARSAMCAEFGKLITIGYNAKINGYTMKEIKSQLGQYQGTRSPKLQAYHLLLLEMGFSIAPFKYAKIEDVVESENRDCEEHFDVASVR